MSNDWRDPAVRKAEIDADFARRFGRLVPVGLTRFGPCGECPVGECDDCRMCQLQASLPGAKEHDVYIHPSAPEHAAR